MERKSVAWYYAVGVCILVLVSTMFVRIPLPSKGFFNFGDVLVIFGAKLLGRRLGGIAGAVGSALADIISGYAMFAPLTFVAKGLEGFIAGGAFERFAESREAARETGSWLTNSLFKGWHWALAGGLTMALCYFVGECIMPQIGVAGAIAEIIPNLIQAVGGAIGGLLLYKLAETVGIGRNI